MTRVGLLHTVPALAGTFDAMLAAQGVDLERVHLADASLLQTAIREGVTDAVREAVAAHIVHLAANGADAILVTCSSIGEAAEHAAARVDVPVLRVDAAMARDAVALAVAAAGTGTGTGTGTATISVLATNTATLGPTTRLLQRELGGAATSVTVSSSVVEGAVAARDAGRPDDHDRLIAEAVADAARSAGVIVLAQASMAAAADRARVSIPVLTSPDGGVASLLSAVAAPSAPPSRAGEGRHRKAGR
jgi:aspartate/glutamate racemase